MQIFPLLSDEAILGELGSRIAQLRIGLEWSQAAAAERAEISKRTLERLEAGNSVQLSSLVRLRVSRARESTRLEIPPSK